MQNYITADIKKFLTNREDSCFFFLAWYINIGIRFYLNFKNILQSDSYVF